MNLFMLYLVISFKRLTLTIFSNKSSKTCTLIVIARVCARSIVCAWIVITVIYFCMKKRRIPSLLLFGDILIVFCFFLRFLYEKRTSLKEKQFKQNTSLPQSLSLVGESLLMWRKQRRVTQTIASHLDLFVSSCEPFRREIQTWQ